MDSLAAASIVRAMQRLADALIAITARAGATDLATHLGIPQRTMVRWIAALKTGDISGWSADVLLGLAQYEAQRWGTATIAESFRTMSATKQPAEQVANTREVAEVMGVVLTAHTETNKLLSEMAVDIADGQLQDHEARRMVPLIETVLEIHAEQTQRLAFLRTALRRQLAHRRT